jgi:hypothetical protein
MTNIATESQGPLTSGQVAPRKKIGDWVGAAPQDPDPSVPSAPAATPTAAAVVTNPVGQSTNPQPGVPAAPQPATAPVAATVAPAPAPVVVETTDVEPAVEEAPVGPVAAGGVCVAVEPGKVVPRMTNEPGLVSRFFAAIWNWVLLRPMVIKATVSSHWYAVPVLDRRWWLKWILLAVLPIMIGGSVYHHQIVIYKEHQAAILRASLDTTMRELITTRAQLKEANRRLAIPWWKFWAS